MRSTQDRGVTISSDFDRRSRFAAIPASATVSRDLLSGCAGRLKWEIRGKLDQANINERVLFPGLDGLSRWLARFYMPTGVRLAPAPGHRRGQAATAAVTRRGQRRERVAMPFEPAADRERPGYGACTGTSTWRQC